MAVVKIGCETCNKRYHCDSMTEFECLKADFRYYSPDYSAAESAQSKPFNFVKGYYGYEDEIVTEMNRDLRSNPEYKISKVEFLRNDHEYKSHVLVVYELIK